MAEYISREAALKKLQMQLLDLEADQDKGEYSELCENRGARDALDEAIYDIRTLKPTDVQPVNQWISVKDRLPEEMQDKSIYSGWSEEIRPSDSVFVLTTGGSYDVAWHSYVYKDWTTDNEAYTYKNGEIAFWQPLPEPPKED